MQIQRERKLVIATEFQTVVNTQPITTSIMPERFNSISAPSPRPIMSPDLNSVTRPGAETTKPTSY